MYTIRYVSGGCSSFRGPFASMEEAEEVLWNAPVPPGTSYYLEDENGDPLIGGYEPDEEEEDEVE